MKSIKAYTKAFLKEDDGMELLQVAVIVLVAAALAAVIWGLASKVKNKINDAGTNVDSISNNGLK